MAKPMNINGMVNDILFKYDHNKSGAIELKRPEKFMDKVKNPDERQRTETSTMIINDEMRISTAAYTMRDLFYAADKDNDGKATREEITEVVKGFDKNNDGELSSRGLMGFFKREAKGELELFNDQYRERTDNYSSVGIPLE